jgi:hypothetical protein
LRLKRFTLAFVSTLLGSVVFAAAASACTETYRGPSGGNWGTASNWSPATVPTSNDDVCINPGGSVLFNGDGGYAATVNSITIATGATLEIEGESNSDGVDFYPFSQLYVNNAVTVNSGGNLLLDSTANSTTPVPTGATSGGTAELFVGHAATSGTSPTLTNDGTITTEQDPGTSFGEYIEGGLDNAGTLNDVSGTLTVNSTHEPTLNSGTWTVNPTAGTTLEGGNGFVNSGQLAGNGAPITLEQNAWTQSGGSVTGSTVTLYNGDTLNYGSGSGSFEFTSGNATNFLTGTIPAGQTVTVNAGANGNALVVLNSTVTNNGTFILDAPAGSNGSSIIESNGAAGAFVNNGTVDLIDPITTEGDAFQPNFTNSSSGLIDVESGTTYFGGGNPTGVNNGTIEIAPGAALIQQGGLMTNNGTLSPEIASAGSIGQYDLYEGTFDAGGSLSPVLTGGFVPTVGQEFVVLNIGNTDTYAGNFASGGNGFTVDNTNATVEPGDVGAIYDAVPTTTTPTTTTPTTTTPTTTTPTTSPTTKEPAANLTVSQVQGVSGKPEVTLRCAAGHTCAGYSVTATVVEHLKGKQITKLTATRKRLKLTTRTVTIAMTKGTVAGGRTVMLKLSLNTTGAALLKRYGKLKAVVTVTEGARKVEGTVTLTEPKAVIKK